MSFKKKKKKFPPQGVDWHAQEHEVRRKKLEDMRQALGVERDRSGTSTMSHDSSVDNDSPNTSTEIPDIFSISGTPTTPYSVHAPKSHTIEKMENNGTPIPSSYRHHAKKRSGSWGDLPKNNSDLKVNTPVRSESDRIPDRIPPTAINTSTPISAAGGNLKRREGGSGRMTRDRGSDVSLRSNQDSKLSDLDINLDR